jgi:glyoxalase family protein
MKLEGLHHVTAITGDAPANVSFYTDVMGLRMVKKTVNQDDPTVYHLFYADEKGSAGSDITFFEYPGLAPGRAGDGMVHRVVFRVGSEEALDFWQDRLQERKTEIERSTGSLAFTDPEGLGLELSVDTSGDEPLTANHPGIPAELAIRGFDGVRAFSSTPEDSVDLLESHLGFAPGNGDSWSVQGDSRRGFYKYDPAPESRPLNGAGTVHHVAWASPADDHEAWRERVAAAGVDVTPVIDRYYFRSIYFREPSGVLFEIATLGGAGFAADEDPETLGEALSLPPNYEHLRDKLASVLTPLPEVRTRRST